MSHRTFDGVRSIEAVQHLLDNRCERNHPKRHRTAKRSAKRAAEKRQKGAARAAMSLAAKRRHVALVRAYWAGERDEHP